MRSTPRGRVKGRALLWLSGIAVAIASVTAIMHGLCQYPRHVFLSDLHESKRIIVDWRVRDGNNGKARRVQAYEVKGSDRSAFVATLGENVELDYFRGQATVPPMIGIYLLKENDEFVAYYTIRRGRGGGRCLSMESLREIASSGRPLSDRETATIFSDNLRSKWPHVLPWPACRFDYVLPATH